MSPGLVAAIVGLLLLNAFFVGAEFAIISARRSSIEPKAASGSRSAATVLWAMENVSLMLATAQLGITVCSVSLGSVAEPAIAHAIEGAFHGVLSETASHAIAVAIALFIIVGLHVIVGEMIPKNAAVSSPDKAALILGPALVIVARVARPLIAALNAMANLALRAVGVQPRDEVASAFTADEVHSIVERSSEEGLLADAEGLLTGAIEFSDHTAADVMVPWAEVVTVPRGVTAEQLEAVAVASGFSRFPVVSDGGDVVGYLHIKDALQVRSGEREEPIADWRVRNMAVLAPGVEVESALATMRASGSHVALVRGDAAEALGSAEAHPSGPAEPGPALPAGAVFLEDIIEELVGEVRDHLARPEATEP